MANRAPASEFKTAIAYHEAGHAVATVLAFRMVVSPNSPPPLPVKYAEINEESPGKWGGICFGPAIYATQWPDTRIGRQWRDAMEWQLVIDMAGGIAEAIHRGARNKRDMMWFALLNCGAESDLESADAIQADMQRLIGRRHGLRRFSERACVLLRERWSAVEAIAAVLNEHDRIDGTHISEIVRLAAGDAPDVPHLRGIRGTTPTTRTGRYSGYSPIAIQASGNCGRCRGKM